jgi:hypothetical protein
MKKFMLWLNGVLAFVSFCVTITHLITASFGLAWLFVPITAYFLLNAVAIDAEYD